jgi:hypothetical protein
MTVCIRVRQTHEDFDITELRRPCLRRREGGLKAMRLSSGQVALERAKSTRKADLKRVRPGAGVLEVEPATSEGKGARFVAGTVVAHEAHDRDCKAGIVGDIAEWPIRSPRFKG